MSVDPVANEAAPEVAFSDAARAVGQTTDEAHLSLVTSGDVIVIDLKDRADRKLCTLHILGSEYGDGKLLIGVSVDRPEQTITATVYGPLQQMTSEHVRSTGRSVAAFPSARRSEIEIAEEGLDADA